MARNVAVGYISGAFGVRGWVKVHSDTDPPENILGYSPWLIQSEGVIEEYTVLSGGLHGQFVIAQLEGIDDREKAVKLRSSVILVSREKFSVPEPGHYYWADLMGLGVKNLEGAELGKVVEILPTGANDVLVTKLERERLIPFVMGQYVRNVDLEAGLIVVDWEPNF